MDKNNLPIISLRHVDITFGRGRKTFKAVSDASFDIFKGETVSLVGESGSGKTTIGRAIVRINPVSNGYILFKNRLINGKIFGQDKVDAINIIEEKIANSKTRLEQELASVEHDYEKEMFIKKQQIYEKNCQRAIKTLNTGKLSAKQKKDLVKRIQMIFQDPAASLNERATIEYIVGEGLDNYKLYSNEKERMEKIEKVITEVGLLPEHLTRYPHEFSGGQRQRVGLARSIVMEPEFIVADEPISALDVSIRAQVLNLLKEFQRTRGLTYLFIAHDLSIVRFISDRIVVIHLGKIVEIAETEELFNYPLHPYTKSLMSAIPIPDPILEKNKNLFVYDAKKVHNYAEDEVLELVDVGHNHFVLGNKEEIENYKAIREGK